MNVGSRVWDPGVWARALGFYLRVLHNCTPEPTHKPNQHEDTTFSPLTPHPSSLARPYLGVAAPASARALPQQHAHAHGESTQWRPSTPPTDEFAHPPLLPRLLLLLLCSLHASSSPSSHHRACFPRNQARGYRSRSKAAQKQSTRRGGCPGELERWVLCLC